MNNYSIFGKRVFDVVTALVLLIAFAPIMALVALAIRLTSAGPILFLQPRVGKQGKFFNIYKFRTMYTEPRDEAAARRAEELSKQGIVFKVEGDPRVTPVGRFLRLSSLDELPQLVNILRGEMSLVGPRPLPAFMVRQHPRENEERSRVLPGITGYWQIYARADSSMLSQMIDYDRRYIRELSFTTDLKVLARTLPVMFSTRGAK